MNDINLVMNASITDFSFSWGGITIMDEHAKQAIWPWQRRNYKGIGERLGENYYWFGMGNQYGLCKLNVLIIDPTLNANIEDGKFRVPIQFPSGRIEVEGGAGGDSFIMSINREINYEMSVRTEVSEDDEDDYRVEFHIVLHEKN